MAARRLQGHEATSTTANWVGLSRFLPGGGAGPSASGVERIYVVLDGEITVTGGDGAESVLRRLDSVVFAPGETRTVENRTALPASMLVLMPYPAPG
jgi:quercetin dioxygenase-like cupin family protein